MISKYTRGMVYWATIPNTYGESFQHGHRPCVIVSNDMANIFSKNVTIVPCTTNMERHESQPTHFTTRIQKGVSSVVLCESILTVSKTLLDEFIGVLDDNSMKHIDDCVAIALGLKEAVMTVPKYFELDENEKSEEKPAPEESQERITSDDIKKQYLEDFDNYGVQFVVTKYNVASIPAAYSRRQYYKKAIDKS